MNKQTCFAFVLFICGWLLIAATTASLSSTAVAQPLINLPTNFTATVWADHLELPVDIEFLPSGDIFVAEKGVGLDVDGISKVKLLPADQGPPITILTLSTNSYWDSGLIGLVLDPDFANNGYFYVLYSTGEKALNWVGESSLRLSRFTYHAEFQAVPPASELILLDNLGWEKWHHGGGLAFDEQGYLYIGIGDMEKYGDAQNLLSKRGKILRIKPTAAGYEIPADNPYLYNPLAPPELYAVGFRNPFRMSYNMATAELLVADVGHGTWEEINVVESGRNYGWSVREGPCPKGQYQPCAPTPGLYTKPLYNFPHIIGEGSAITGLTYYSGLSFPADYRRKLFFADYSKNTLEWIDPQAAGDLVATPFASNLNSPVDVEYAYGKLYVVSIETGQIIEIAYQEDGQALFDVRLTAAQTLGPPPLAINFVAEGVNDDTEIWRYHWEFGDGSAPQTTNSAAVSHTYTAEGVYTAVVQVTGSGGSQSLKSTLTVVVYNGEIPELHLTNLDDNGRMHSYHAGDQIKYEVVRPSGTSDLHPETPYTWTIDLVHNQHRHFLVRGHAAESGTFTIPTETHGSTDIFYRFTLTMHTADGREIPVTRLLSPELVSLQLMADPSPIPLKIDGVIQQTPYTFPAIIGEERQLQAEESLLFADGVYQFSNWEQNRPDQAEPPVVFGGQPLQSITVPTQPTSYTARYLYQYPQLKQFLPILLKAN